MKAALLAVSLAMGMTVLQPSIAAEDQNTEAAATDTHAGHGKVVSVDTQAETVKLTHDPIKSLKWPKMTMDFKARDPALLKDLKPGDQVDFELTKIASRYLIIKISPSTK